LSTLKLVVLVLWTYLNILKSTELHTLNVWHVNYPSPSCSQKNVSFLVWQHTPIKKSQPWQSFLWKDGGSHEVSPGKKATETLKNKLSMVANTCRSYTGGRRITSWDWPQAKTSDPVWKIN
jgi:hypothetical protein